MCEREQLPPWTRWIGKPKYDAHGIPIYKPWETCLDTVVHAVGFVWAIASSVLLLNISTHWRFVLFSTFNCVMLVTSSLYNVIGCGLRIAPGLFRMLDQSAIFAYFGSAYTLFIEEQKYLRLIWFFCGTGIVLKLAFGKGADVVAMVGYVALGVAPVFLLQVQSDSYSRIASSFGVLAFGGFAGYINNIIGGGMVFWHICCFGSNVLVWWCAYDAANAGKTFVA